MCIASWMLVLAWGVAAPLVVNGDFEQVVVLKAQPTADQGFGVWAVAADLRVPARWELNSAYPGRLTVLTEGARSGRQCLRIEALGQRDAHLFQPCPALRAGVWYKVGLWVRDGTATIMFYEYFQDGRIGAQTICQASAGAGQWRQAFGLYTPTAEGFRSASLAVAVLPGRTACIDDVTVEEFPVVAPPTNLKPIVLDNEAVRVEITGQGRLASLVSKRTGVDYAQPPCPLPVLEAVRGDLRWPVHSLERRDDLVVARFIDPAITASLRVVTRPRYFLFEVVDVQPAEVTSLTLQLPLKALKVGAWAMGGRYDDAFGYCLMAVTPNTICRLGAQGGYGLPSASWQRRHGFKGAQCVLIATPFDQYLTTIQQMEQDTGLPSPKFDGQWAKLSEAVRKSYLFVTDYADGDIDKLIEYAKIGGFDLILFLKDSVFQTHGHFLFHKANFPEGQKTFKQVVEKIHAAGLRAGLHVFGPSISPTDPYVTPRPDDRLLYVTCPPLARDVDASSEVIELQAQPDLPPKTVRTQAFPGYCIRVGDEIIQYGNVEVGPPFRFTGCRRGVLGTKAAAHKAGTPVRGLLQLWGYFLADPDTTILEEVTRRFGQIVNDAKLDMVYFDASDGIHEDYVDRDYYLQKWHLAYYRAFDHDVLYQTSNGTGWGLLWHLVPRSASADGHGDLKGYLDQRLTGILHMKDTFTASDVGWYGLDLHWKPDQLEYVAAKCLGCDGSISVQANMKILTRHPRAREIMEMLGRYEKCRLARHFPPAVKQKLLEPKKDFKLFSDGRGGWTLYRADYGPDRLVAALDGKANVWTMENDRPGPCAVAVEIQRDNDSAGVADYDHPQAIVLSDFRDVSAFAMSPRNQYEQYVLGDGKELTPDGPVRRGVTQHLATSARGSRREGVCGVYTARNAAEDGGWCGKGRRFEPPLDLSAAKALAVWVHGDGQGETFYFQLRDTAGRNADCFVPVMFKGWRLWTFPRRPEGAFDWKQVEYVILYLIGIPAKAEVSVKLEAIKALPTFETPGPVAGLELTIGSQRVRLPVELAVGQCVTLDGLGACLFWPGGMQPGRPLDVPNARLQLQPGANTVSLSAADPKTYPGDVSVRLCRLWPLEE